MAAEIILTKNGNLFRIRNGVKKRINVTERAIEFLFDPVAFGEGVTLKSIFVLLKKNPMLFSVFSRYSAMELVEEAFSASKKKNDLAIDYIELANNFDMPGADGKLELWPRLSITAMGVPLSEPTVVDGCEYPAGYVEHYCVSDSTPSEFMSIPIRYCGLTGYWGDKLCCHLDKPVPRSDCYLDFGEPILGQVINSILYEFSYFGVGAAREDFIESIIKSSDQAKWVTMSADEVIRHTKEILSRNNSIGK